MEEPLEKTIKEWKDEYLALWNAERSIDFIIKNKLLKKIDEGFIIVLCIDTYDFLDWFFDPGITFHDEHYPAVHNLWSTVEDYLEVFDPIKVCLLPVSAIEVSGLLKQVAEGATNLEGTLRKSLPKHEFDELAVKTLNRFRKTQSLLSVLASQTRQQRLLNMVEDGRIIPVDDLLPSGEIDLLKFSSVVGKNINESPGLKYMFERRKWARGGIDEDIHTLSIQSDMLCLKHVTYLNEILEPSKKICILSTHGWVTLRGYEKSYFYKQTVTPFAHSFSALCLAALLKKFSKRESSGEFITAARFTAEKCMESIYEIPGMKNYLRRSRTRREATQEELLKLPPKGLSALRFWKEAFENEYFTPTTYVTSEDVDKAATLHQAADWLDDQERRRKHAAIIRKGAKLLLSETNFVNPDAKKLLTPLGPVADDVLLWLFTGE